MNDRPVGGAPKRCPGAVEQGGLGPVTAVGDRGGAVALSRSRPTSDLASPPVRNGAAMGNNAWTTCRGRGGKSL
jgi:hypothetical protein